MIRASLVVVGFGSVGRSLVKIVAYRGRAIANRYSLTLRVVGVVDSKGMAFKAGGFEEHELLKLCELPRSGVSLFKPYARDYVDLEELYSETQPDVHVELTPSNYETGEPGLSNILRALSRGVHVVTANKAPIALHYGELMSLARNRRTALKFGATVMGGTPFIETLSHMKIHEIEHVEGILNATTNYILTEMHKNLVDFEEALKRAKAIGVAEADPSLDIEGVDAAAKLTIISHVVGRSVKMSDVERESLTTVKLKDVVEALRHGHVLKYVASLDLENGKAFVKVLRVPRENLLATVDGTLNCVRVKTSVSDLVLVGKGGGGPETAYTVLNDVLSVIYAHPLGGFL
ncbi:MAG: homoserine dehydrogenase [Desulfurococcaceae archaeon]